MTATSGSVPGEVPAPDGADWEQEGRRVGESLDGVHLVLVLGSDARQTALAALGIARAQSGKRRVALGDLLGDAEPIQSLVRGDDPHGLVDSFRYGVSLNKIAQEVPDSGELYVLPSGSEAPEYEEIFTHARWHRLASGFRETGALLVVAAPADASRLENVVRIADGVVLVGDAELVTAPDDKLLGRVRPQPASPAEALPSPEPQVATTDVAAVATRPRHRWYRLPIPPAAAAGLVLAVTLAGLGIWLAARPLARGHEPAVRRGRSTGTSAGTVPSALDSAVRLDSMARAEASIPPELVPANAADSGVVAAYAIWLASWNTQAGAIGWLQSKEGRELPAATYAATLVRGATWYRSLAGAYRTAAEADSLLATLRARGQLRPDLVVSVVRAPYAFLVDSLSADAATPMLKYFADRGQPVYALRQADGSARLYAGAFETREQAALFLESIRASGIRPVLVYRIGRVN